MGEYKLILIYILDRNLVYAFDQVEALDWKKKNGRVEIRMNNPTRYDAKVSVLAESKSQA